MITFRNFVYWIFLFILIVAPLVALSYIVRFRLFMLAPILWYSGLLYWGVRIPNTSKRRGTVTEFELIRK